MNTIMDYTSELMIRLCAPGYASSRPNVLLVAAHPDDEVIGAGSRLNYLKGAAIVHVTDGAPRDMLDALECGFRTRKGYAHARRKELLAALGLAGIGPEQCIEAGCVDQEASYNLYALTEKIFSIMRTFRPEAVLTHPYEGGHPDHDATAFCVHAARRILEREGIRPPEIIEFSSYHGKDGKLTVAEFIPSRTEPITVVLSGEERELKKRMFECFVTQAKTISMFAVEMERFRPSPSYDFTQPPHPGRLFYENYDWGITGVRWRVLAREAISSLGIKGAI